MALNQQQLDQILVELAVARGGVTAGQMDAKVSPDAKLIASAIVQAGGTIAVALSARDS
jgi:hypothetical protein